MKKNVTIYDVAREAGVSLATVSRVINGSSVVKAKTRDRVLETIQRLDFKPNQIARGLATSKTTTIAIVFPQSLFAHVKDMIGGIGDTSRRLDYNVSIYTTDEIGDGNPIETVMERVIKSRADGVILFNNDEIDKEIEMIEKYKIPAVIIGGKASQHIASIMVDSKAIAFDIVNKYLDRGQDNIAFVIPKQNLIETDSMIEGIVEAYQNHGKTFDMTQQVIHASTHYEKSYQQFLDYFKEHRHDLVFAGYDKEAVAAINAAIDNGIRIPEDMEVIGMMDTNYALMCRPALTSVHVPVYDMGALAVRLLTKILNEENVEESKIVLHHLLMPRETTL